jgi:hypothetical protein
MKRPTKKGSWYVLEPSDKVDGIVFGYMEKSGKGLDREHRFFAVKVEDIVLQEPVQLIPNSHTDGKGFGPNPSLFGDRSARRLLSDIMAANPEQKAALTQIYKEHFGPTPRISVQKDVEEEEIQSSGGYLLTLLNSNMYLERDLQEAIESLWPCLSSTYELLPPQTFRDRNTRLSKWRPDITAQNQNNGNLLIVEMKSKHGYNRNKAIDQVIGYAKRYRKVYPKVKDIKLLVIGPWEQPGRQVFEFVQRDGYRVGAANIEDIGNFLVMQAERMLLNQQSNRTLFEMSGI